MGGAGLSPPGLDAPAHGPLAEHGGGTVNRKLFFGIGFIIWLLATIVFRAAGHLFFLDEAPAILALLWLLTAVALAGLAQALFRWQRLARPQRFEAAALLVIAGMILDAVATEGFEAFFPNMPSSAAGSFGAWLLIAYASVLLAAFLPAAED